MNYLLSVLCYDNRQNIHIQFKYIYIRIDVFNSPFVFPGKSQFGVLSLAVMSRVCRHTVRKSRGGGRCAQTPSSNTSHKTYSKPLLSECDNISPPTNTTIYQ